MARLRTNEQGDVRKHPGSDASLSIGFLLCFALTITAYCIVQTGGIGLDAKIIIIAALAFIQFVAQMFFFLHLGRETTPRWKLWMFLLMVCVVGLLVIGSLWIMHNLDYNMMNMSQSQKNVYMGKNEGL